MSNLPIERAIMGFSGWGVSFIDSTTVRMGLKVLRARSEAVTDQLRLVFILSSWEQLQKQQQKRDFNEQQVTLQLETMVNDELIAQDTQRAQYIKGDGACRDPRQVKM